MIKKFFNWLITKLANFDFKDWVILILACFALSFLISSRYYRNKANHQEIVYVNDSIEIYKNKLKEEYSSKQIYIQEISDLKKNNAELYAEVKNLKDNPIVVTKTKVIVRTDTIEMKSDSIIVKPDTHERQLYWSSVEPNGYYKIGGQTNVMGDFSKFQTTINQLEIPATITFDIIEKDKQLRFISKTDNPYINITNMDGVMLDPTSSKAIKQYFKPKRFGIGFQLGAGIDRNLKLTPYIGVGMSYNIIRF